MINKEFAASEAQFFADAQETCSNAIDLLLKLWKESSALDETIKVTLQGLNALKDYFICEAASRTSTD